MSKKLELLKTIAVMGAEEEYHELILNSQEYLQLEQALRLQPQRTKQEYIDEIIDGLNRKLADCGVWYVKKHGKKVWGFVAHDKSLNFDWHITNDNYGFMINLTIPIDLAKLIIDFFTEYGDTE